MVESRVEEAMGDREENIESGKDVKGEVHKEVDDDAVIGQKGQARVSLAVAKSVCL